MSKKTRELVEVFEHLDYRVEVFDTGMFLVLGKSESGQSQFLGSSALGRESAYEEGYVRLWNVSNFQGEHDQGHFYKLLEVFDNFKKEFGFSNDDFVKSGFINLSAETTQKDFIQYMLDRTDVNDSQKWCIISSVLCCLPRLANNDEGGENWNLIEEVLVHQLKPEDVEGFTTGDSINYLSPFFPNRIQSSFRRVEDYRKYLATVCFFTTEEKTIEESFDKGFSFVSDSENFDRNKFDQNELENAVNAYLHSKKKNYGFSKTNFVKFYNAIHNQNFAEDIEKYVASRYLVDNFNFANKSNPASKFFLSVDEYNDFVEIIKVHGGTLEKDESVSTDGLRYSYGLRDRDKFYQILAYLFVKAGSSEGFDTLFNELIGFSTNSRRGIDLRDRPHTADDGLYSFTDGWCSAIVVEKEIRILSLKFLDTGIPMKLLMNMEGLENKFNKYEPF